jgi:hypothetical protein
VTMLATGGKRIDAEHKRQGGTQPEAMMTSCCLGARLRGGPRVPSRLERVQGLVASFTADRAYDCDGVHAGRIARLLKPEIIVPPRAGAVPALRPGPRRRSAAAICIPSLTAATWAGGERLAIWRALVEADVPRSRHRLAADSTGATGAVIPTANPGVNRSDKLAIGLLGDARRGLHPGRAQVPDADPRRRVHLRERAEPSGPTPQGHQRHPRVVRPIHRQVPRMALISRYSSSPKTPNSRPLPDCL